MKRIAILLFAIITISACTRDTQVNLSNQDWFLIEIIRQSDGNCNRPLITFLDRQQEAYQIIANSNGIYSQYVALGLPKVNYPVGTTMYVSIRQPKANEAIACITFGPSYSHVYIDNIK